MLTKIIFPVVLLAMTSASFAATRIKCAPASDVVPEGATLASYASFFQENKIIPKTDVSLKNVEQFKNELEKFPLTLRLELVTAGSKIHIMEGVGVTVDPTWPASSVTTFDGRPWSEVPGGGGSTARGYSKSPTRIVINRLYDHQGSSSLLLHEHAHSLDSMKELHGISNSVTWNDLLAEEPKIHDFLMDVCGTYCADNVEEGFAELFANYYGCQESKIQMINELPRASDFFRRFISMRSLQDIWKDYSTPTPRSDEYRDPEIEAANGNPLNINVNEVSRRVRRIFGRLIPRDE